MDAHLIATLAGGNCARVARTRPMPGRSLGGRVASCPSKRPMRASSERPRGCSPSVEATLIVTRFVAVSPWLARAAKRVSSAAAKSREVARGGITITSRKDPVPCSRRRIVGSRNRAFSSTSCATRTGTLPASLPPACPSASDLAHTPRASNARPVRIQGLLARQVSCKGENLATSGDAKRFGSR